MMYVKYYYTININVKNNNIRILMYKYINCKSMVINIKYWQTYKPKCLARNND